jgi:hypothetical protein
MNHHVTRSYFGSQMKILRLVWIVCKPDRSPARSLQRYLTEGRTHPARCLAKQAVVLLEPKVGVVIWPNDNSRSLKS